MALFELKQDTGSGTAAPWAPPTFKDCVAADIDAAFFEENEHADRHTVDGKDVLIVLEDDDLREHSAHWEAGAKQNFDTGLYTAHTILYIRVEDYGPKPKIGKQLVLDKGTKSQRTYTINLTFDNGTEFAAAEGLERSCVNKRLPRTKVYFCHPYSSWERGTNENTNGMIRRRFPKGTNFAAVTNAQIAQAENWINNYPRKILGYKSSEIVFRECLRELGIAA